MTELTPKQEKFAQAVADGMTQADAYRTAYDVSNSTKAETIQKRASELMSNGAVSGRVQELKSKLEKRALWTREMSVRALVGVYKDGKPSDRIAAVKELNVMHGYNAPIKHEVDSSIRQIVLYEIPDNGRPVNKV